MAASTELFETCDMNKLKHELAHLVKSKDYETINMLLRRNPNTRELNEFEYRSRCKVEK